MNIYQHKVHYYETDKMGITHHSNYLKWMEEARIDFLSQIGWDYAKLEEMGIISPVTAMECRYKKSTTFSDVVDIIVGVESMTPTKLKVRYEMKKGDVVVCEGSSEHGFLNKEGRIINLKRQSPDLYNDLVNMMKTEENV